MCASEQMYCFLGDFKVSTQCVLVKKCTVFLFIFGEHTVCASEQMYCFLGDF